MRGATGRGSLPREGAIPRLAGKLFLTCVCAWRSIPAGRDGPLLGHLASRLSEGSGAIKATLHCDALESTLFSTESDAMRNQETSGQIDRIAVFSRGF